jgi:hypothetical protein
VTSLVLDGNTLFVGGLFADTRSPSLQGKLRSVAMYDLGQNQLVAMQAGVNKAVTSLGLVNGQVQVMGNFSTLLNAPTGTTSRDAAGSPAWDINSAQWVNNGGHLVGSMAFVAIRRLSGENGSRSSLPAMSKRRISLAQPAWSCCRTVVLIALKSLL